jgi:hypothetical protein
MIGNSSSECYSYPFILYKMHVIPRRVTGLKPFSRQAINA